MGLWSELKKKSQKSAKQAYKKKVKQEAAKKKKKAASSSYDDVRKKANAQPKVKKSTRSESVGSNRQSRPQGGTAQHRGTARRSGAVPSTRETSAPKTRSGAIGSAAQNKTRSGSLSANERRAGAKRAQSTVTNAFDKVKASARQSASEANQKRKAENRNALGGRTKSHTINVGNGAGNAITKVGAEVATRTRVTTQAMTDASKQANKDIKKFEKRNNYKFSDEEKRDIKKDYYSQVAKNIASDKALNKEIRQGAKKFADRVAPAGKLKYEDLTMEDYQKYMHGSRARTKDGKAMVDPKTLRKMSAATAGNMAKNTASKATTGVLQGLAPVDVIHGAGLDYNKNERLAIKDVKNSKAYERGYMGGFMGQFLLSGAGSIGQTVGKSAVKGAAKAFGKEVGEDFAGSTGKKFAKQFATNRLGEMIAETPINVADAVKMATDENGRVDKKALRNYLARNAGMTVVGGGAADAVMGGFSAKKAAKFVDLRNKQRAGTITSDELKTLDKYKAQLKASAQEENTVGGVIARGNLDVTRRLEDKLASRALSKDELRDYARLTKRQELKAISKEETKQLDNLNAKIREQKTVTDETLKTVVEETRTNIDKATSVDVVRAKHAMDYFESTGMKAEAKEARAVYKAATKNLSDTVAKVVKAGDNVSALTSRSVVVENAEDFATAYVTKVGMEKAASVDLSGVHGFYDGEKLHINGDSDQGIAYTFGHELTHVFESTGKEYDDFVNGLKGFIDEFGDDGEWAAELEKCRNNYAGIYEGTEEQLEKKYQQEAVANLVGKYFFEEDGRYLDHLVHNNVPLFSRIYDFVKKLLRGSSERNSQLDALSKKMDEMFETLSDEQKAIIKSQPEDPTKMLFVPRERVERIAKEDPSTELEAVNKRYGRLQKDLQKKMERDGDKYEVMADYRKDLFKKYGWMQSIPGDWVHEISDAGMAWKNSPKIATGTMDDASRTDIVFFDSESGDLRIDEDLAHANLEEKAKLERTAKTQKGLSDKESRRLKMLNSKLSMYAIATDAGVPFDEVLQHNALKRYYPEVLGMGDGEFKGKGLTVKLDTDLRPNDAAFIETPESHMRRLVIKEGEMPKIENYEGYVLHLNPEHLRFDGKKFGGTSMDVAMKKDIVHELQHYTQYLDGRSRGSDEGFFRNPDAGRFSEDNMYPKNFEQDSAKLQSLNNKKEDYLWDMESINESAANQFMTEYRKIKNLGYPDDYTPNPEIERLLEEGDKKAYVAYVSKELKEAGVRTVNKDYLNSMAQYLYADFRAGRIAERNPKRLYGQTAGEWEARISEDRVNIKKEDRGKTFPLDEVEGKNVRFQEFPERKENYLSDSSIDDYYSNRLTKNSTGTVRIANDVPETAEIKLSAGDNRARYHAQIDNWDGKTTGFSFVIGDTTNTLQTLGLKKQQIRLDSTKVLATLKDHPNMSRNTIKQIPDMLDDPIAVAQSKSHDSRIVVVGELYDDANKPVTVVLELLPMSRKGSSLDITKVVSAQGRSHIQSLFPADRLMYVNPDIKKTENWLNANRVQFPLRSSDYGLIRKISYDSDGVKLVEEKSITPEVKPSIGENKGRKRPPMPEGIAARKGTDDVAKRANDAKKVPPKEEAPKPEKASIKERKATAKETPERFKVDSYPRDVANPKAKPTEEVSKALENCKAYKEYSEKPRAEQIKEQAPTLAEAKELLHRNSLSGYETSKHLETIYNAGLFESKELRAQLESDLAAGHYAKVKRESHHDAVIRAEESVNKDWQKAYDRQVNKMDYEDLTAYDYAERRMVMNTLENMIRNGEGDVDELVKKHRELSINEVLTVSNTAAALNASKIMKSMTPAGRAQLMLRKVEKLNNKFKDRLKGKEVELTEEQYNRILKAETDEEAAKVLDEINDELMEQIPSNLFEKLNEVRRFTMLFNLRTHERNLIGNTMFWGARSISDVMEYAAYRIPVVRKRLENLGGTLDIDRFTYRKMVKENNEFLTSEWDRVYNASGSKTQYRDIMQTGQPKAFKSQRINKLLDLNYDLLEKEDMLMFKPTFKRAYAQWCSSRGITNLAEMTEKQMEQAGKFALQKAEYATFRDDSMLSKKIVGWKQATQGKKGKTQAGTAMYRAANMALEGHLPFVKTPVNILRRSIDYSPIAVARGVSKIIRTDSPEMFKAAIHDFATGMTGTGVAMLGALLVNQGHLTVNAGNVSGDAYYDRDMGYQDYSLVVHNPLNNRDYSVSIDWASPLQTSLFMGAAAFEKSKDAGLSLQDFFDVGVQVLNPMLDMSFMQTSKDTFDMFTERVYRNGTGDNADWGGAIAQTLFGRIPQGYLGSLVPQMISQAATGSDQFQRDTRSTKEDATAASWESWGRQIANKFPVLRWHVNNRKINRFGEDKENTGGNNIVMRYLNAMVNPSNVKRITLNDTDKELIKIYNGIPDSDKDKKFFFYNFTGNPDYDLTNGKRMSYKELYDYGKTKRQNQTDHILNMFDAKSYKNMTNSMKVDEIDDYHWVSQVQADHKVYGSKYALERVIGSKAMGLDKDNVTDETRSGGKSDAQAWAIFKERNGTDSKAAKSFVDFWVTKETLMARAHSTDYHVKGMACALTGNGEMGRAYDVNADKIALAEKYVKNKGKKKAYAQFSDACCNIVEQLEKAQVESTSKANRSWAAAGHKDIDEATYRAMGFDWNSAQSGAGLRNHYGYSADQLIRMASDAKYEFDADKNGSLKKAEVMAYIDSLGIKSNQHKACLFEYINGGGAKNPYDSINDYLKWGENTDDDGSGRGWGRRRGRRGGWGRRGGGGGGSGSGGGGTMPETASGAIKGKVTDPFSKTTNGSKDSNLDDAYRKKAKKLREQSRKR